MGRLIPETRKRDNELKCSECGFEVYSESTHRHCARCNAFMNFVGKKSKKKKY